MAEVSPHQPDLEDRLQSYLDGTLPRREAVRLFLAAERDPALRARLEEMRRLFATLDSLPREEPSTDFDARVLAQVPLEKYRSAPRRPQPVLYLGTTVPSLVARVLRPLRNGATALSLAYLFFLVVSHSFLARAASSSAAWVGELLGSLVARTQGVPVASAVAAAVAGGFAALTHAVASLARTWGGTLVTLALGVVVGAAAGALVLRARRRHTAREIHA